MCTAISFKSGDTYFGRNLDVERGYGEKIVIAPRNFSLRMRCIDPLAQHYGMIGMAAVMDDFPLYFEATNEKGLSAAGLNFPGNAYYHEFDKEKMNITPFEFIPWILGQCATVTNVKHALENLNLVNLNFNDELTLTPLHWMISDQNESIVVESMKEGLRVFDNPFDVLTNSPTFAYHLMNINNYMALSIEQPEVKFPGCLPMDRYSLGMGALGLPGDFSSASRFVRACFVKESAVRMKEEKAAVNQFLHILDAAAMPLGCVCTGDGFEYTRYSSCCNVNKGIYYYKTYEDTAVKAVKMDDITLNCQKLQIYEI